ncbi:unnamed protein product [Coffea canephora]|uniref:Beta-glucosidase n=1 Tax=Coffea canephora TaxID=49390 RepID=A0A068UGN1_COFCA|nr:unnamed protein product [Coffea canephora]
MLYQIQIVLDLYLCGLTEFVTSKLICCLLIFQIRILGGRLNAGLNKEGIQYYCNLIDEILANGIIPFATLLHFDIPRALEDEYRRFLDEKIVQDFGEYAKVCFWHFGDRVKHWITINEPWTIANFGYVIGTFPPNRGSSSTKHANLNIPYTVSRNMLLVHAEANRIYKEYFKDAQGGQIGITLNSHSYEPYNPNSDADKKGCLPSS